MKLKFQDGELGELKNDFLNLFELWFERVTPNFADPFFTLSTDGSGLYLSLTDQDEYDVTVKWEDFENEILTCDHQVIEFYLPKFKSLFQKMENELEDAQ